MDQKSLVNNIAEVVGYPAEPVAERDLEDRDACTRLTEVIHLYICLYYLYRFLIYNTWYIQELLF